MNIHWNAENYKKHFSFVPQYGADVISLITAEKGSFVVDLGCGNGTLSKKLCDLGYAVTGIDASEDMLALAKAEYPDLKFLPGNALSFELEKKADVIFSNAVFHWIDGEKQDEMLENIANQLAPGGELVCEFGGYGCAESVHGALEKIFAAHGLRYPRTFYFPTIGEYAPRLEAHGLRVEYASLFDRPTVQQSENGLTDWINMFVTKPFEGMDPALKDEILKEAEDALRDNLFIGGKWVIDYVRIRFRARKI